ICPRSALERDEIGKIGKATGALRLRGHRGAGRYGLANPGSFVIEEPEGLVSLERAARRAAELILLECAAGLVVRVLEESRRIEFVVPQKLPCRAVQLVGARLERRIEDGAPRASELRAERIGLQFEFADRVHGRLYDIRGTAQKIDVIAVVVDAIEQEVVLRGARAVRGEPACGVEAAGFRLGMRDAGREASQEVVIAAAQRK